MSRSHLFGSARTGPSRIMGTAHRSPTLPAVRGVPHPMTRRHGYGLLAAMITLVVAVSAAIYVGATLDDGNRHTRAVGRGHSDSGNDLSPSSAGAWVGSWSASPVEGEPGTET